MEAMWINFECVKDKKFVIRPFLGGVSGITGEGTFGDMSSLVRRMNNLVPAQDYVVLPDQKWIDGISTNPGIVKQFVATEMVPPRREDRDVHSRANKRPRMRKVKTSSTVASSHHDQGEKIPIGASIEWQVTG
jgi:hypothetical protein